MDELLEEFYARRNALLNDPAQESSLVELEARTGPFSHPLIKMYRLFNGEKLWGAWLPGYRLSTLAEMNELMESTVDAWEWLEEERGQPHVMRSFFPIVSCAGGASIGPIYCASSRLHNNVVEYRYETGELRIWSKSVEQFFDGFIRFSLTMEVPKTLADSVELKVFGGEDCRFLSQWPDVVYPVVSGVFENVEKY
jgi:hypothetical protein